MEVSELIDDVQGKLASYESKIPMNNLSASEIMADTRYQKLNDAEKGPLSLDRVTRDGPRDIVGDIQDLKASGPFFDIKKSP